MPFKRPRGEQSPSASGASPSLLDNCSSEDIDAITHLLQRSKRKFAPPSFSLAPAVPLPLWQRVVLSALKAEHYHETESRRAKRKGLVLTKELAKYHADAHVREERQRRQQREARVRIGSRIAQGAARYWSRRGESFQQLMKVEFEIIKHHRDKRKQEDLLRETEELTKKLLESIIAHKGSPAAADCSSRKCKDSTSSTQQNFLDRGGDGTVDIESSLALLDTQGGLRPLRHYQRSALHWMVRLYEHKLNGILADEMGLGKTVQTIALLCYYAQYRNDWGPHLIVVPTTVVLNWKAELERWAPGLKVLTYIGSSKERHRLRTGWTREDAFHVCITSYNLVVQDRNVFRRRPWGFLVLDEAHQVKNFMSKKWQSLFDLQAEYRLLLTGTPLQNSMMELWSLLHFLLPFASAFRSNEEFKEWFSNPLDDMITGKSSLNEEVVRRLQALIRPFMLRRLKKDVESQLPSKTEKVVMCRLSRRQRSMYDDYMHLADTRQRIMQGGTGGVLSVLLALRKVCDHPDLFQERPTISPFVPDHLAQIELSVPRVILIRGNDYRGKYRFPVFEVLDLNEDARRGYSHAVEDTHFDWLPCRLLTPLFHAGLCNWGAACHRFAAKNLLPFPTEQWQRAIEIPVATREPKDPEGCAGFVGDLWAVETTLGYSFGTLAKLQRQRHEMTCRLQHLRYLELACSIYYYAPAVCTITPVSAVLQVTQPHLCSTIAQRCEAAIPILRHVAMYVPAVQVVRPPRLHCAFPVRRAADFESLDRQQCAALIGIVSRRQEDMWAGRQRRRPHYDGAFFLAELWPIHVRRCFSFPNKGLLIHDCGKLQFLSTALDRLRQEGHRMLIFTQFVKMLNILERFLALIGVPYLRLDGSTKAEMRQVMVDRFNTDERIPCMILSTRSGGIGLNLTGADTVIFYDSDWNPTMDLQAQDRCHRIGQMKPVTIYRLISEHTVEESILQKARERKKLNNVVIRGGQFHAMADVADSYEDSAAAFAALSDPVNLRSFFHDLDEDATVRPAAEVGANGGSPTFSAQDVLTEMGRVEDVEDRDAQEQLEVEMRERQAAETADLDDDEKAAGGASVTPSGVALPTAAQESLLTRIMTFPMAEAEDYGMEEKVRMATCKRRRTILDGAKCDLDRLLTVQYAMCNEADAVSRYDRLCTEYERAMEEEADQLPPFRSRLLL